MPSGGMERATSGERAALFHGRPRPLAERGKGVFDVPGSSTRSQIKRAIKAYEAECGPLVVRPARTPDEARAFFAELLELHNIAWQARGKEGAFAFQEILDFHLRMVPRAIVGGDVQLLRISAGDTILGVLYNFVWRGRVSSYQSGFAFSERNKLKPGLVCHTLAVKHCMEAGLSTYDFLAGNHRYKAQLSTDQGLMRWVRFERRTTKMGVLQQAREARNTLRNWKAGVVEWRARRALAARGTRTRAGRIEEIPWLSPQRQQVREQIGQLGCCHAFGEALGHDALCQRGARDDLRRFDRERLAVREPQLDAVRRVAQDEARVYDARICFDGPGCVLRGDIAMRIENGGEQLLARP